MSLRLALNLIVGALTLLFTLGVLALQLRNMRESIKEEVVAANRVAAQLLNRTVWGYAAAGTPALQGFLQGVGRVRSNDITLTDAAGNVLYRSPPSPYKAGRDAPPWFAALVAPAPSVQAIAFPDGRVEVHANASRAVLDAWDDMRMLLLAALALLVTVQGAVFALVGGVTRPFGRIVDALRRVQDGAFDTALPPLPGREAGAIGTAFNRMVGELGRHIETERRAARAEAQLVSSRELTLRIDRQLEDERRTIARELHDEFGQSVTALRSLALLIEQRVQASDATAAQAARAIADESQRLYDAMHGIIPRLAPLVLDPQGLMDALDDLLQRTRRAVPATAIDARLDAAPAALAPQAALTLYRAAQEGLSNALRHGAPQRVALGLRAEAAALELTVSDDGRGPPAGGWDNNPGHYGLRWLDERVRALGGTLRLEPGTPRGSVLRVRLPLEPAP